MLYEKELGFIRETLKKCRIRSEILDGRELQSYLKNSFFHVEGLSAPSEHAFKADKLTVYKYSDSFGLRYHYFLLFGGEKERYFVVGPYLPEALTKKRMLELGESNGIPPQRQHYLEEYYSHIPIISEDAQVFIMLDTFCEMMWQTPSYAITEIGGRMAEPIFREGLGRGDDIGETLVAVRTMESRYEFENELIRAVSLGQLQKEKLLIEAFNDRAFEKRLPDLLRNAKNYCIIMNTLLRKAAESGGVHPVHIDRVSSEFAAKIEKLPSVEENASLMREMFRTYCRLVRKHTMKSYSLPVQKTMLMIDSDLAADISPKQLSEAQNVSLGYLSAVFKRETGKTMTEYIREKRMEHAMHLLATTNLQVQTVAIHCGIVDVQYFSKIFKKQVGKTPKEYRESAVKNKRL